MKIKLFHKVFGAFLLTAFMTVALMVGIMKFYVSRNFTDYVNRIQMEKLDGIVKALVEHYQEHEGWTTLRDNPGLWRVILNSVRQNPGLTPSPPHPDSGDLGSPKSSREEYDPRNPSVTPFYKEKPSHSFHRHPLRILRGLCLLDEEKHLIAGWPIGNLPGEYTLREIAREGVTIGWLALHRHERLLDPPAMVFMKQQSQVFFLTGGGILLFAAIVSFLLSRHFLAPIRELTTGTQALTFLKFDTRIEVSSKDELGQLASDFNIMAQTLESYEKMRKQWVSDIAHELRTPLAILRGEIEAMQDGVRKATAQTLDSLHSEALHLTKIVNDLHELSVADTGALHLNRKPVNPVAVLRRTLGLFQSRLAEAEFTVREELGADHPSTIFGDADRLAQLYSNLLENTLRYADRPGTLTMRQEVKDDQIVMQFEDSGPGVPEYALDRLFDRLYRVDSSRARNKGGTGLGLAICKTIVEAHGGTISASNSSSGGLRVQVQLPIEGKPNALDQG